jgi:ubiquinone/menaquinone biosynthesis C-methylase UbiE
MAADLREPADASGLVFRVCAADSIPFEDNAADLVLLSMSAHHLEHLETTLIELRRVLRPGGAIILREHDFSREADRVFMDLVHLFYACIAGSEEEPREFLKTFWSNYQSQCEWTRVFEKNGFSLTFATKFNKRDIFNSFYAVFTKRTD